MNKPNPSVDGFIRKSQPWQEELKQLRAILLDSPLTEEVKWRAPCYTFEGHNVAFIGGFKDNCVLSFIKGALLKDPKGLLTKPGENTQSARVIRFTSLQEIIDLKPTLKAYILEAIELEKSGAKVDFKEKTQLVFPEELQKKFDQDTAFEAAFAALTPGRQRAYNLYFTAPKQSKTRESRVEKYRQQILDGKGMND
jgi:uncharacterized protein YdeI (YjbR/CyaY-like superfamily)